MESVFYAYPSNPAHVGETIEFAISRLSSGQTVSVTSWKQLYISGKPVITEILNAINAATIFACDLTYLNFNVLFELGYAISRGKRIWISLNETVEHAARDYKRLGSALIDTGYAAYSNSYTLESAFYRDQPWSDLSSTLAPAVVASRRINIGKSSLLYLKSPENTDGSVALSNVLEAAGFLEIITDDPNEAPSQTLEWYAQHLIDSDSVIAHLLADDQRNATWHNAKCSLVCGMARGYSKHLLMLAQAPFDPPFDYQLLLRVHRTATECRALANTWLDALKGALIEHHQAVVDHVQAAERIKDLRGLTIGEFVAEYEEYEIDQYFVPTSAYTEAVRAQQTVFVGRKGTGKTANLYAVAKELGDDKRNHVCVIKPVGYELEAVIRMLGQSIQSSEKGFLVESLWKFLIYTELAQSVANELYGKPLATLTEAESALLALVDEESRIIAEPFSIRLQNAVESLSSLENFAVGDQQRARISELLHNTILQRLRAALGNVLESRQRVAILVDNLDKAWDVNADMPHLSLLLFGLLSVARLITSEFQVADRWRRRVNLTLTVFLRSDIFSYLQEVTPERDKLEFTRVMWNDPELLFRVLDARLSYSFDSTVVSSEIWRDFFTSEVNGVPTRQFIIESTLQRPRDVIYLVKMAISEAVNRGHSVVEGSDFVTARSKYSQFAFGAILAEDYPEWGYMESVLYEFSGGSSVFTRAEVEARIRGAGVPEAIVDRYIDLLCDVNFLGIETASGQFEFPQDEARRRMLDRVARTGVQRSNARVRRYAVHPAFRDALEIE